MALLTAFRPGDVELTLAELTRRTGIPKATAHRLLAELVTWNVVERTAGGIRLGMGLFELGQLAPLQRGLREAAVPFLADLFEATHETAHLAVPDGIDVVYVQKLVGRRGRRSAPGWAGGCRRTAPASGRLLTFAPPERLADVLATGLTRRTPRTVIAPGLLDQELGPDPPARGGRGARGVDRRGRLRRGPRAGRRGYAVAAISITAGPTGSTPRGSPPRCGPPRSASPASSARPPSRGRCSDRTPGAARVAPVTGTSVARQVLETAAVHGARTV